MRLPFAKRPNVITGRHPRIEHALGNGLKAIAKIRHLLFSLFSAPVADFDRNDRSDLSSAIRKVVFNSNCARNPARSTDRVRAGTPKFVLDTTQPR
jgi:predicted DNA-binding ribbon-helix-helix protein